MTTKKEKLTNKGERSTAKEETSKTKAEQLKKKDKYLQNLLKENEPKQQRVQLLHEMDRDIQMKDSQLLNKDHKINMLHVILWFLL